MNKLPDPLPATLPVGTKAKAAGGDVVFTADKEVRRTGTAYFGDWVRTRDSVSVSCLAMSISAELICWPESASATLELCQYCKGTGEYPLHYSVVSPCDQCGCKPGPVVRAWT